jgi:UDP-glucose 4-epimerase
MIIAVTGSSGFIGSRLVRLLRASCHTVIEVDLVSGMDITVPSVVDAVPKIDVLVHLAGKLFVPDSYLHPRTYYTVNIIGTVHALEICRKFNARMVLASSYVYGVPQYLPIDELHPVAAFNPYAQSKLIGEQLCQAYLRDFNVASTILRPFNIYGPKQNTSFLIPSILHQAGTGVISLKDPKPKRDYIFIDDVVRGFARAVEFDHNGCETFNVASGVSVSVEEIAALIRDRFYPSAEIRYDHEQRRTEVPDTQGDIKKALSLLHWTPSVSLMEGVSQCIEQS